MLVFLACRLRPELLVILSYVYAAVGLVGPGGACQLGQFAIAIEERTKQDPSMHHCLSELSMYTNLKFAGLALVIST